jgi:hypothetical protein
LLLNGPLEKKVSQVMTSVLFAILISLVDWIWHISCSHCG